MLGRVRIPGFAVIRESSPVTPEAFGFATQDSKRIAFEVAVSEAHTALDLSPVRGKLRRAIGGHAVAFSGHQEKYEGAATS